MRWSRRDRDLSFRPSSDMYSQVEEWSLALTIGTLGSRLAKFAGNIFFPDLSNACSCRICS